MYIVYLLKRNDGYKHLSINRKINAKQQIATIDIKADYRFAKFILAHSITNELIEKMQE